MNLRSFIPRDGKVLEIGPLDNPFCLKSEYDVFYSDVNTTEQIRDIYKDSYADLSKLVEIDFPLSNRSYVDVVGDMRFAAAFSSNCIEHIPNPIKHFRDIADVLEENGRYVFRLPDKRNCQDMYREVSPFRDLYDVFLRGGLQRLCADSAMLTSPIECIGDYHNSNASFLLNLCNDGRADLAQKIFESDNPLELAPMCHIWVFTHPSILSFFRDCLRFNLLPFVVEHHNSLITEMDYYTDVVLKKTPSVLTDNNLRLREILKLQLAVEKLHGIKSPFSEVLEGISRDVWIYGAGEIGKFCFDVLVGIGVDVKGFVISDGQPKLELYCEKPVKNFSEYTHSPQSLLIVALSAKHFDEISESFSKARLVPNTDYCKF